LECKITIFCSNRQTVLNLFKLYDKLVLEIVCVQKKYHKKFVGFVKNTAKNTTFAIQKKL